MSRAAIIALALTLAACQPSREDQVRAETIVGTVSPADPTISNAEAAGLPPVYHAEGFKTRIVYYNPNCTVIEITRPDGQVFYMGQGYRMACSLG